MCWEHPQAPPPQAQQPQVDSQPPRWDSWGEPESLHQELWDNAEGAQRAWTMPTASARHNAEGARERWAMPPTPAQPEQAAWHNAEGAREPWAMPPTPAQPEQATWYNEQPAHVPEPGPVATTTSKWGPTWPEQPDSQSATDAGTAKAEPPWRKPSTPAQAKQQLRLSEMVNPSPNVADTRLANAVRDALKDLACAQRPYGQLNPNWLPRQDSQGWVTQPEPALLGTPLKVVTIDRVEPASLPTTPPVADGVSLCPTPMQLAEELRVAGVQQFSPHSAETECSDDDLSKLASGGWDGEAKHDPYVNAHDEEPIMVDTWEVI